MLAPADAAKKIFENIPAFLREDCPLASAHGRVLRADVCADRELPPFDRVTMDGYALRSSAVAAGTRSFVVEGIQAAGMRPLKLSAADNACVEVMTGAVLPEGADAVVPYEQTTRDGEKVVLERGETVVKGLSVHWRGSDHAAGNVILHAGTRLTGREIAVAAAVGASTLTVAALPKIAIIATGDELVEVDAAVALHQIRRSNEYALRAALITAGFPHVDRFHFRDVRHEIEQQLRKIVAEHDVVLITGGVSKGKFDFLPAALAAQNVQKCFQGVAQRPGKPFWFGLSPRRTPVFALPGNPVSAYTCLHRYVLPALAQASGIRAEPHRLAALAEPVVFKPKLTLFLPVILASGSRAELLATPHASNTSGDFAGLVGTDGFVELPPEQTHFEAGTVAPFWSWA